MKLVLLDTNFLMVPYQFGIDIFSEIATLMQEKYELVTLSAVVDELKKIKKGEDLVAAEVGIKLIDENKVRIIETSGIGDPAIIDFAKNNDAIICTNDAELRKRLRSLGISVIYLRQRAYLEIDGII